MSVGRALAGLAMLQASVDPVRAQTRSPAAAPQLVVQRYHQGAVHAAVSADSTKVLSGDQTGLVILWDVGTGLQIRHFIGHIGEVTGLAFTANGRRALTMGADSTTRLWDLHTGAELKRWRAERGIFSSAVPAAGGFAAIPDGDSIIIWDADRMFPLRGIQYRGSLGPFSLSSNGRVLVVATHPAPDGLPLKAFDIPSGDQIMPATDATGQTTALAVSADGELIARGNMDYAVEIWSRRTGQVTRQLLEPRWRRLLASRDSVARDTVDLGIPTALAFAGNDRQVIAGGTSKKLWVFDVDNGSSALAMRTRGLITGIVPMSEDRAILGSDGTLSIWRSPVRSQPVHLEGAATSVTAVRFSPDGQRLLTGSKRGTIAVWDLASGSEARRFALDSTDVRQVRYLREGAWIFAYGIGDTSRMRIWDARTGARVSGQDIQLIGGWTPSADASTLLIHLLLGGSFIVHDLQRGQNERFQDSTLLVLTTAVSYDGRYGATGGRGVAIWNLTARRVLRRVADSSIVWGMRFNPDGSKLLVSSVRGLELWARDTGQAPLVRFQSGTGVAESLDFSNDGQYVVGGGGAGARMWDARTGKLIRTFVVAAGGVSSVAISPDSKLLATGGTDGATRLWNVATGKEIAALVSFRDTRWSVVSKDGRFDTSDLHAMTGLTWVVPQAPLRVLPAEIFMREYFEPSLLPRLLTGSPLDGIRSIADINRAQPAVEIVKVVRAPHEPDVAEVTVSVAVTSERDGTVLRESGAYDLHILRDGQLAARWPPRTEMSTAAIGEAPDLRAWQTRTRILSSGASQRTFQIKLPRVDGVKQVTFSAYAFNSDRVKSATASHTYDIPMEVTPQRGRAYVVTIGVADNQSSPWRLFLAEGSARLLERGLIDAIERSRAFAMVVPIPLIATFDSSNTHGLRPTKRNVQTVLDLLAGRTVAPADLQAIPPALRASIRPASPNDLVLISFSGHGISHPAGEFYMIPFDLDPAQGRAIDTRLFARAISSNELAEWMDPIDAGQTILIVDACQAAAVVDQEGFKPGPMGSRGFGQLSYDKGMVVLAATQSADESIDSGELLASLVTHALIREALGGNTGTPVTTLKDALRYAAQRVPLLASEVVKQDVRKPTRQVPKLFDYTRRTALADVKLNP